jgi:C-terminal processing protease CtpA/Prc
MILRYFILLLVFAAAPVCAQQSLSADDIRADLHQLYATLQEAHYDLFARTPKDRYDALYQAELAQIHDAEDLNAVAKRLQRFVAAGHVAHARIDTNYKAFRNYLAAGGKAFPLNIRVVGGTVYLTDNGSGLAALRRGDEIVALDGNPVATWLDRASRNLSADTPYLANALLELDFPMALWLERGPVDSFMVTVRHGGRTFEVNVPAKTRAEMAEAAKSQPPALALDSGSRLFRMLDEHIAYLRPGPFYNDAPDASDAYDNKAFHAFIDKAFADILAHDAKSLIIDLRDNHGGDSSFSDLMIAWFADRPFKFNSAFKIKVSREAVASNQKRIELAPNDPDSPSRRFAAAYAKARIGDIIDFPVPESQPRPGPRFTGRVYLLINRNSYSNCVAVAALVQDYRFATVIGEETADLATTFGAMETFTLDKSGLTVGFPKAMIIRPDGDLTARGVVPDIAIATPLVEGTNDPVLDQAREIAAEAIRRRPPSSP